EAADGLGDDAFAFFVRQRFERLVLEAGHGLAFVVIAHPAFEGDVTARRRILERLPATIYLQSRAAERKKLHPPATGGMKTTVSPWASGAVHSLKSVLIATLS